MQTELLAKHAIQFVEERPTLHEQLENPLDVLNRLLGELHELRDELVIGQLPRVLDELTDVANYFATLEYVICKVYGITADQIVDHSHFKYVVRNGVKYEKDGYQNGIPAHVQQKRDVNGWASAQSRSHGATVEQIIAGEKY
jgi:hypothetical protein